MQYYTHQQMAGGPRYTGKSLIGNWNEDFQQEDNLVREVLFKAQTGTLKLNQHSQKVNTHSEPVALSGGNSGAIRLGEPVEVVSLMTGSRLAVEIDTRSPDASLLSGTTNETYQGPTARTTFVLEQYVPPRDNAYDGVYQGDVLRYGMKVRLYANAVSMGGALEDTGKAEGMCCAVGSEPASSGAQARLSKHQIVNLRNTRGTGAYSTVWQVVTPNAEQRILSEGLEVLQGAPIALIHCATQMPLCVEEKHKVLTDFGYEYEVSAHADVAPGRVRALDDLYQGKLLREANRFVFNIGFGGDAPADGGDADGDAGGDGEAE